MRRTDGGEENKNRRLKLIVLRWLTFIQYNFGMDRLKYEINAPFTNYIRMNELKGCA